MALPFNLTTYTATIAPGASLSAPLPMGADTLAAIAMPAEWVAADLTFRASVDGGVTWLEVYTDDGEELTVSAAANTFVAIADRVPWCGINNLQVRSGTAGAPVIQTAGATITLITAPVAF